MKEMDEKSYLFNILMSLDEEQDEDTSE